GSRASMVTPWSTSAVEITQNMNIEGIIRIEEYHNSKSEKAVFDEMLSQKFKELNQHLFDLNIEPEKPFDIDDIAAFNREEGLAMNDEEIEYLENLSKKIGRKLTDSEVFGFSQINS